MAYTRHNEFPIFEVRNGWVEAALFNQAQLVLKRNLEDVRFAIPGLKTLELIVQRDAWIIVDNALNDVPIAAWLEFEVQHRTNLHLPVSCHIHLFHANAGLVLRRTEVVMLEKLSEILKATSTKQYCS